MIPVEGHQNLFRDEKSGAIVNTDSVGYEEYIKMREEKKKQREEIDVIKNDIIEIKSLLKELINDTRRNRIN
jgi:hypothetical protein